ncbi:choice-of-anchor Q domain-containing protein [Dyadobacter jiangsuensis]
MSKFYSLAFLFSIYAFHVQGQRIYVNLNASGSNDGTSWANAYADFQTAIYAAASGDSIFVAQATYQPTSGTSFVMKEGVKIFGGFQGAETGFSQRNLANKATLQGNGTSVILNKSNGLTSSAMLDGFIITGGNFTTIGTGSAAGTAGGINNIGSSPTITNCFFSGNTGVFGGGMSNSASSPTITNCTFSGNTAAYGAGIYNELSSTPTTITNCIFSGNTTISTAGGGAGMFNVACAPTIANCIFSANNASGISNNGDGMVNYFASPTIVNCTFWSNSASNSGGGMFNTNSSNPTITNCIIGSNTAGMTDPGIFNNANSAPVISYSDVQGGLAPGIGNIYADPLFTDAANGNFTLKTSSPCRNTGNNAANTTATDLAGNPRISGFAIDMGAYEYRTTRGYVKLGATGASDGTSWTDAYTDFQTAINAAINGDSIFVAQATYLPASGTSFVMKEGVKIFGGFVGTETAFNQRNLVNKATLHGNGSRVITNDNNGLTTAAVLDGFIMTGGNAQHGGGMYNYSSSPTISNCTFTGNNITSGIGGGVVNFYASPVFINCVFSKNVGALRAGGGGGGMGNTSSSPVITNCTFSGNHASFGGAIRNHSSSPTITNTIIWGNTSNNGNAGIDNSASAPIITYSDVQDGVVSGTGNISADPKFVNAPGGDYRLLSCSPAINAGNNAANSATTDLDGSPRIYEGTVDMGAYELQSAATFPIPWPVNQQITKLVETNSAMTFDENCNLLAALQSMGDGPVTGEVTAKVWIEDSQPAHYVRRHYEITPADGAATATGKVTLYFTQEDFNAFNLVNPTTPLPANLRIEKRAGTSSDNTGLPKTYPGAPETLSDVETLWNSSAQRWEVSFEVTGFSGFFVKTSEAPLPVSWISLSARRNDASQVVLDWRVDERAVSHYQVERSLNARNFVPAGTLTARGDGTTEYTFTDPTPVLQRAYYRIRQTDLDGSYSYSRVLSIAGIEEIGLTAFPNPASGIVTVQMEQRYIGSRLKLVNKSGIVIEEITVKGQTITLDLGKYAPGVYLLSTADGRVMKLVRQ